MLTFEKVKVRRGDGRRAGKRAAKRRREDEKKRNNLLWLSMSRTDRLFTSDAHCVREREGERKKKENTQQLNLLQMFRCIHNQEIKTYALFVFPQRCLHSCMVCPTLIIHYVCLY